MEFRRVLFRSNGSDPPVRKRLRRPPASAKSLAFPGSRTLARRPERLENQGFTRMRPMQELRAEARPGAEGGPPYKPRRRGGVPAFLYGGEGDPKPGAVTSRELERHVSTGTF